MNTPTVVLVIAPISVVHSEREEAGSLLEADTEAKPKLESNEPKSDFVDEK